MGSFRGLLSCSSGLHVINWGSMWHCVWRGRLLSPRLEQVALQGHCWLWAGAGEQEESLRSELHSLHCSLAQAAGEDAHSPVSSSPRSSRERLMNAQASRVPPAPGWSVSRRVTPDLRSSPPEAPDSCYWADRTKSSDKVPEEVSLLAWLHGGNGEGVCHSIALINGRFPLDAEEEARSLVINSAWICSSLFRRRSRAVVMWTVHGISSESESVAVRSRCQLFLRAASARSRAVGARRF